MTVILDKAVRKELCARVAGSVSGFGCADDEAMDRLILRTVAGFSSEHYLSLAQKEQAVRMITDSIRGLDVLSEPLGDDRVTEIMVNGETDLFIEKDGRLQRYDVPFTDREKLDDVVQRIVAGANRSVNEANPIVDARLPDGSRVNVVLPPVSICGPIITIRKFPKEVMTMEKLVDNGSISGEAADRIGKLVRAHYNIFISGGTGSGKTTFLNAISQYIPEDERLITIEDSAELQIKGIPNLVRMETRNANVEGRGAIHIRELIKTSLRMRPDRIIIGEVRDEACIDMLQALNTGHSGMSTGHANSAADMISRMETMVLLGADIPLLAVRKQIASAIDIIIHLGRLRDKTRRVLEITEVIGVENGEVVLNPLYEFVERGEENGIIRGSLEATGRSLKKRSKLEAAGLFDIPDERG